MILSYLKARYGDTFNMNELVSEVNKQIGTSYTSIKPGMATLFSDILYNEPSLYWNRDIRLKTYTELTNLLVNNRSSINELPDESIQHFLIGYKAYIEITETFSILDGFGEDDQIKARMHYIPTYTTLVEGCLTNLYRAIILFLNETTTKDFASQKKLRGILDVLASNGFEFLTTDISVNIRNAINHGGIVIRRGSIGYEIHFTYTESRMPKTDILKMYELKEVLDKIYDLCSAVILSSIQFIQENFDLIKIDFTEPNKLHFDILALNLSYPTSRCNYISLSPDGKQINLDFVVEDIKRSKISELATFILPIVYNKYPDFDQYMILVSNERTNTCWIRYKKTELMDIINRTKSFAEVLKDCIERKDFIYWEPSDESINEMEVKYHRFNNYYFEDWNIKNIQDVSTIDSKRLKAEVFVGEDLDRSKIMSIVNKTIEQLKSLKNVAQPTMRVKHGNMEADSIYLNIFRSDGRRGKNLLPNNTNFICMIDYNLSGDTTLKFGGVTKSIWIQYKHERVGKIRIAWRE